MFPNHVLCNCLVAENNMFQLFATKIITWYFLSIIKGHKVVFWFLDCIPGHSEAESLPLCYLPVSHATVIGVIDISWTKTKVK